MLKTLFYALEKSDLFGKRITFTINNSSTSGTTCGGFLSVLSIVGLITLVSIHIYDYIMKKNYVVLQTSALKSETEQNPTPFLLALSFDIDNIEESGIIFNATYKLENELIHERLQKCIKTNGGDVEDNIFKSQIKENAYCLHLPEKIGLNEIEVDTLDCDEKISDDNCLRVNEAIKRKVPITIQVLDMAINASNKTHPFFPYIKNLYITPSHYLQKTIQISLENQELVEEDILFFKKQRIFYGKYINDINYDYVFQDEKIDGLYNTIIEKNYQFEASLQKSINQINDLKIELEKISNEVNLSATEANQSLIEIIKIKDEVEKIKAEIDEKIAQLPQGDKGTRRLWTINNPRFLSEKTLKEKKNQSLLRITFDKSRKKVVIQKTFEKFSILPPEYLNLIGLLYFIFYYINLPFSQRKINETFLNQLFDFDLSAENSKTKTDIFNKQFRNTILKNISQNNICLKNLCLNKLNIDITETSSNRSLSSDKRKENNGKISIIAKKPIKPLRFSNCEILCKICLKSQKFKVKKILYKKGLNQAQKIFEVSFYANKVSEIEKLIFTLLSLQQTTMFYKIKKEIVSLNSSILSENPLFSLKYILKDKDMADEIFKGFTSMVADGGRIKTNIDSRLLFLVDE